MKPQRKEPPSEGSEQESEIDEETDEVGVVSRELPEDYQMDIFDSIESVMNNLLGALPAEVRAGDLIGFRIHPTCLTITLAWKKNLEPDPEEFRLHHLVPDRVACREYAARRLPTPDAS